jgi:hypothetical protein
MTSRPTWVRLDVGLFSHPKIKRLESAAGMPGVLLYIRAISYSTEYLTDGWVPLPLPKEWGYGRKHTEALEDVGLWIPLEITDDGGWIINDYPQYQLTRAEWERRSEKGRAAARKRWAGT